MIKQSQWFERKFASISDNGLLLNILERLEGTPIRIKEKTKSLEEGILIFKPSNKWSVKEEIGHLCDLEPLWFGRIHDLKSGKKELRPADLSNTKTHEAGHNEQSLETLVQTFNGERQKLMALLFALTEADLQKSALHPRLRTPMRIIDLCYFVAEHDDHHLARMTARIKEQ